MLVGAFRKEVLAAAKFSRPLLARNAFAPLHAPVYGLDAARAFSTSSMTELQRQLTDKSLKRRYCTFA